VDDESTLGMLGVGAKLGMLLTDDSAGGGGITPEAAVVYVVAVEPELELFRCPKKR
jgi:hypothetical protein